MGPSRGIRLAAPAGAYPNEATGPQDTSGTPPTPWSAKVPQFPGIVHSPVLRSSSQTS